VLSNASHMLYNFKNKKIIYRQELISVSDPDSLNPDPGILLNPDPERDFSDTGFQKFTTFIFFP
jgi:hypothetical protein